MSQVFFKCCNQYLTTKYRIGNAEGMPPWLTVAGLALVIIGLAIYSDRLGISPGEKRVYLFEDQAGERWNPLGAMSEGCDEDTRACIQCGTGVKSATLKFCESCLSSPIADD